jgi:hypothetical protein
MPPAFRILALILSFSTALPGMLPATDSVEHLNLRGEESATTQTLARIRIQSTTCALEASELAVRFSEFGSPLVERRGESFTILFGDFPTLQAAIEEKNRLEKEHGLLLAGVEVIGAKWLRVVIGKFGSPSQARQTLVELEEEGFVHGIIMGEDEQWTIAWHTPGIEKAEALRQQLIEAGFLANIEPVRTSALPRQIAELDSAIPGRRLAGAW